MRLAARLAAVLLAGVAPLSFAQDVRLAGRLDQPTLAAVTAVIDSAKAAKLLTAPLVDKALEGSAKGFDGPKIVGAVRQLAVKLGEARRVLGPSAKPDEVRAAAGALDAGVSTNDLARVHAATGKRSVTMPFTVLTDLIVRGVAIPTATDLVLQMARSGVKDGDLTLFQRNVRLDIERGADATTSAQTRTRGLLLQANAARGSSKPS